MNDVIIRKITKSDKDAYFELADLFYHSPAVLHPVPKKNIENTWDELMRSNEYLECFFAVKGDEPIGFMLLAYTFSQESGGKVVWLEEIFVREQYRNRGAGKLFFKYLDEHIMPTVSRIRLEVEPDNDRAKALYSSLGFTSLPYEQMVREI